MKTRILITVITLSILFVVSLFILGFFPSPFEPTSEQPTSGAVNLMWSEPVLVYTETIQETGGVVEITDPTSALYGLRIEVPDEATDQVITFTIHSSLITQVNGLPDDTSIVSQLIQISASGSAAWNEFRAFEYPVLVTLPYDDASLPADSVVRFYCYDEAMNVIDAAGFLWEDTENHTVTFYAGTFSGSEEIKYFALLATLGSSAFEKLFDTGFTPDVNGWYIPNKGSYLRSDGNCGGMILYAKWYFTYKRDAAGVPPLQMNYIEGDPNEWRDDSTAIQLATRAQIASETIFRNIQFGGPKVPKGFFSSAHKIAKTLLHGLYVTGLPQIFQLGTVFASGDLARERHMVLVYGYSAGRFLVYDPNHPREEHGIPYTYWEGFSETYKTGSSEYNGFLVPGSQTYGPTLFWSQLFDAAEIKFQDTSIFPTVTLTSSSTTPQGTTPEDTDGDNVRDTDESTATITGIITGGQEDITSTLLFINNQKYQVRVDNDEFTLQAPLQQGDNQIIILATDVDTRTSWAGYHRDVIKCTATKAALTITLTWKQDNSDIDLHVLEPTIDNQPGRHIYYQNKGTEGQYPYLNIDNTWGKGPEHYYAHINNTLPNVPTTTPLLYGTYQMRVHYFSDHDDNPDATQVIDWTLTFRYLAYRIEALNTEYWIEDIFTGHLSVANTADTANFQNSDSSWSTIWSKNYPEPDPEKYRVPPPPQNIFSD